MNTNSADESAHKPLLGGIKQAVEIQHLELTKAATKNIRKERKTGKSGH